MPDKIEMIEWLRPQGDIPCFRLRRLGARRNILSGFRQAMQILQRTGTAAGFCYLDGVKTLRGQEIVGLIEAVAHVSNKFQLAFIAPTPLLWERFRAQGIDRALSIFAHANAALADPCFRRCLYPSRRALILPAETGTGFPRFGNRATVQKYPVFGESLIRRQIAQLNEVGITKITVAMHAQDKDLRDHLRPLPIEILSHPEIRIEDATRFGNIKPMADWENRVMGFDQPSIAISAGLGELNNVKQGFDQLDDTDASGVSLSYDGILASLWLRPSISQTWRNLPEHADFMRDIYPLNSGGWSISAIQTPGPSPLLNHLGEYVEFLLGQLLRLKPLDPEMDQIGPNQWRHPTSRIGRGVDIQGPLYLGAHANLGHYSQIKGGAVIETGASIGRGSYLRRAVMLPKAVLAPNARLDHMVQSADWALDYRFQFADQPTITRQVSRAQPALKVA